MKSNPSGKSLHLISNGRSGRGFGGSLPELAEGLCAEYGYRFVNHSVAETDNFEKVIEGAVDAAEKDGGLVVAAGGDGTIRSVAEKAQGRNVRFAVVPVGTFNFFARTHRIPEIPEEALRLALSGETEDVRLGEVNGRIFLINASLGLYAKAIEERERSTAKFGRRRLVVILSTFISMRSKHRLLNVEITTGNSVQRLVTPMIFIGNNSLQLRDLKMNVAKYFKRDLLAVITLKPSSRWDMIRVLFAGVLKAIDREDAVDSFSADSLTIKTQRSHHRVALDGEMFHMQSPIVVKSLPGALHLVVPKAESVDQVENQSEAARASSKNMTSKTQLGGPESNVSA